MTLEPGQTAPDFALQDQSGRTVRLKDIAGSWVVLWWYPRACSEVCSIQGRALVPHVDEILANQAVILGVSFDDAEANARFASQEGLNFPLLSDPTMEVGAAYGVKRGAEEPFTDAPRRVTYIVDPDGKIASTHFVNDAAGHADVLLRDLRALIGETSE